MQIVQPCFHSAMYTRKSFQDSHGGQDPVELGLKATPWTFTDGHKVNVYKVLEGTKDVWTVHTQEILRIAHRTRFDENLALALPVQQRQHFERRAEHVVHGSDISGLKTVAELKVALEERTNATRPPWLTAPPTTRCGAQCAWQA